MRVMSFSNRGTGKGHWRRTGGVCVIVLLSSLLSSVIRPSHALSLREALVETYRTNPSLAAARARLEATKEVLGQAYAQGRPTISASVDINYDTSFSNRPTRHSRVGDDSTSATFSATLQQPLFRGFSVINGIREAKAVIYAGRADLLRSEQRVLLSAVTAYMNVWRYQSFLRLRQLNLSALSEQVVATTERRRVGEATATDVLQSTARRTRAAAQLSQTRANLASAYAEYERVVGVASRKVVRPKHAERSLPKLLREALAVALVESPLILAAESRRSASRHALNKVRGELLPRADLNLRYSHSTRDESALDRLTGAAITARVVVPLYQGGEVRSRVREATHITRLRGHQVQETVRQVQSDVKSAWSQLLTLRSQIKLNRNQVNESRAALLGLLEQERRGQRTTTDVLNAQQELTDAKTALVATQTEHVIASFSLLSAMGRLNAADLVLSLDNRRRASQVGSK